MNKPYIKEYNEIGECINPITKETPYLHRFKSSRGVNARPYITGNNRINIGSRRNKYSR